MILEKYGISHILSTIFQERICDTKELLEDNNYFMKANQTTVAQFRDLFSKVSRIVKQIVEEDKKEKEYSMQDMKQ